MFLEGDQFVVLVENDESAWSDQTGIVYHYPKRYRKFLTPGTLAIYYKGKLKNKKYKSLRLSSEPHYFGVARLGASYIDTASEKDDLFVTIENYRPFKNAVLSKIEGGYMETIPASRESNYWRDGVRPIGRDVFQRIVDAATLGDSLQIENVDQPLNDKEVLLRSIQEGSPMMVYTTKYERSRVLREQAVSIHGRSCVACGFNFGSFYGDYGAGYIQIHHINPVSELEEPRAVDPAVELIPLCANCHAVVHRRKDRTLSIDELKSFIAEAVHEDS